MKGGDIQDKIAKETTWLDSRVKKEEKRPYDDVVDSCLRCGSTNTGHSPTGWWCNNCGLESPCPCWQGDHIRCIERQNRKRKKSGLPPVTECCCGAVAIIDGVPTRVERRKREEPLAIEGRAWYSTKCPKCGKDIRIEARNYRGLGVHQMATCPHCNAKLVSDFQDGEFVWVKWK